MRAMIWAESNTGGGHTQVVSQLCRELAKRNIETIVVTSSQRFFRGLDLGEGNRLIELPDIKSRSEFGDLFEPELKLLFSSFNKKTSDSDDEKIWIEVPDRLYPWDDLTRQLRPKQTEHRQHIIDLLSQRQEILRRTFNQFKPDILVSEFWPYGRPGADVEMVPFLTFVKRTSKCKVFSLERDVLLANADYAETIDGVDSRAVNTNKFVDLVLVRGDEAIVSLESTYPDIEKVRKPIHYCGYFCSDFPKRDATDDKERSVLISAGGGWKSEYLDYYQSAMKAVRKSNLNESPVLVLVSNNCPEAEYNQLSSLAKELGIEVSRNRQDFKQLLTNARFSISLAGYNSTLEIGNSQTPAVLVPLDNGEQFYRANKFAEEGYFGVIQFSEIQNIDALAKKIDFELAQTRQRTPLQSNGASQAADVMMSVVEKSRNR